MKTTASSFPSSRLALGAVTGLLLALGAVTGLLLALALALALLVLAG